MANEDELGVRTFRRTGVVHATRLDQERTWRLAKGTVLTAQAGDWWVWSGDEECDGRSIAPEEFDATHRPTSSAGVFERTGSVIAHQITAPIPVTTLEGEDIGQPGEWLVTDELGNSWCVPDEDFRQGYVPT